MTQTALKILNTTNPIQDLSITDQALIFKRQRLGLSLYLIEPTQRQGETSTLPNFGMTQHHAAP